MELLTNWEAKDVIILVLVLAFAGAEFIKILFNRKNGCNKPMTEDVYNKQRPEWFIAWERRHDDTHNKIGGSLKEVKEKLGEVSETIARIDERTKK